MGAKCGILEKINNTETPSKLTYNLFLQKSTGIQSFSTLVDKWKEELSNLEKFVVQKFLPELEDSNFV